MRSFSGAADFTDFTINTTRRTETHADGTGELLDRIGTCGNKEPEMTLAEHFTKHVRDLERRAIEGDDMAAKSLACMVLLSDGFCPDDDGGWFPCLDDVVDLDLYRQKLAA